MNLQYIILNNKKSDNNIRLNSILENAADFIKENSLFFF